LCALSALKMASFDCLVGCCVRLYSDVSNHKVSVKYCDDCLILILILIVVCQAADWFGRFLAGNSYSSVSCHTGIRLTSACPCVFYAVCVMYCLNDCFDRSNSAAATELQAILSVSDSKNAFRLVLMLGWQPTEESMRNMPRITRFLHSNFVRRPSRCISLILSDITDTGLSNLALMIIMIHQDWCGTLERWPKVGGANEFSELFLEKPKNKGLQNNAQRDFH